MTVNSWSFCSECQSINRDEELKLYQYDSIVDFLFEVSPSSEFAWTTSSQLSIFYLRVSQSVNCRSSLSSLRHISIVDLLSARRHQRISTINTFLSVETSLDKERDRSHTHIKSSISNKQINIQNIKQKNLNFASFRQFQRICLLQWHSVSSLQRLVILLQWHLMNEFAHRSQWVRYNGIKSACVRFFTSFAINTSMRDESITNSDTRAMTWRVEEHESIDLLLSQTSSSSSQFFACRQCVNILLSVSESTANQNASINKNSKSSNSRSLKQHMLAKSISLCCFCFCSAREIDRFFILICRYLSHQLNKILNKILILVALAHIFCSRSSAFVLLSSHLLLHIYRICSETFSFNNDLSRYLRFSQWISSQCRSIEGMK